jgi:hypothetical protein
VLESRWIFESSKSDCWGQNPLDWRVKFIGKLLEHRCPKWGRMTHLGTQNTSYGQEKGRKSNWQFDSQQLKVGNRPNLLACRWHATYRWKALDEGYNFVFDLIKGLHTKLWASKVVKVPNFGNFKTSTWESQDKMTFGCWSRGQTQSIL